MQEQIIVSKKLVNEELQLEMKLWRKGFNW